MKLEFEWTEWLGVITKSYLLSIKESSVEMQHFSVIVGETKDKCKKPGEQSVSGPVNSASYDFDELRPVGFATQRVGLQRRCGR